MKPCDGRIADYRIVRRAVKTLIANHLLLANYRPLVDNWIEEYENNRPHESLGMLTPKSFEDKFNKEHLLCRTKVYLVHFVYAIMLYHKSYEHGQYWTSRYFEKVLIKIFRELLLTSEKIKKLNLVSGHGQKESNKESNNIDSILANYYNGLY